MNYLNRIKIGARLTMAFMLMLVFLLIISVSVWAGLARIDQAMHNIVQVEARKQSVTADLERHSQSAALLLLQIVTTPERQARLPLYTAMELASKQTNSSFQKLQALPWAEDKVATLQALAALRERYLRAFTDTVDLIELGDQATLAQQYASQTQPSLNALLAATAQLAAMQQSNMSGELDNVLKRMSETRSFLWVLSLVALAAGPFFAWSVTRSIVRPLGHGVEIMVNMADGDLRCLVKINGRDETAMMLTQMQKMQAGLATMVLGLRDSANQVSTAAQSTQQGAADVADGVARQQSELYQINRVVGEFVNKLHAAEQTACLAQQQSKQAASLAGRGQQLIEVASHEIASIASTIQNSADAVDVLRQRANSMRTMISSVTEIAEQTNMLALNAAIEAARAGEAGRGFAVVADEVRRLADRTASATREIQGVIEAMDQQTSEAILQIGHGKNEMARGVKMIGEIVEPLTELREGANKASVELDTLSQNISEQVAESQAIANSVASIAQFADNNLSITQQASQDSRQLFEISVQLQAQMQRFRLA
ncbi:MAG: hypothetical protein RL571_307 [Pseudomonadota bacterium]|jgi:methyl-accepting chemotaxis protein